MSFRKLWVGVAVEFEAFIEFLQFFRSTMEEKEYGSQHEIWMEFHSSFDFYQNTYADFTNGISESVYTFLCNWIYLSG